jgi:PAS domain S-box-containing protein
LVKSSIFRKCQLFTIGCFLLWQNLCLADDLLTPAERVWLQANPDIRVAISPDYPPISFLDATGKPTGFHYQLGMASRKDWPMLASILEKGLASITLQERDTIYLRWNDNSLGKSDAEIYKNWILAALLGVLFFLVYRLFQWDKKLKNSFDAQLKNNNVDDLTGTQLTHESKMALRINVITLITIVSTIIGGFVFVFYFYDNDEYYAMQVIEILLVFFGLVGGLILGSIWRRVEAQHSLSRLIQQTSARERIERKISLSEDRLENQQLALSTLTQNQLHDWHEPSEVFREMAMISAQTLNVERVGVWLFNVDRTQLDCSDLYLKSQHLHTAAEPLVKQVLPIYFNTLENCRLLIVNDVMQHAATTELTHDYMPTHKIGATLEAPIFLNEQFVGVICHEHVGDTREWTLDEQIFVSSIAALASLTIETNRRRQAEQAIMLHSEQLEQTVQARTKSLQESDKRFSYVVQHAPVAILCLNGAREIIEINPEAEKISGYSRAYALGKTYDELFSSEETRAYNQALIQKMAQYGNFQGERTLVRRADGSTVELLVSHSAGLDAEGNPLAIAIAQDMSVYNALETSLVKAREAAESADRTKSMFVASMSHELRTPLNSVLGFLGVVLQGLSGKLNQAQESHVSRAYQSAKHLLMLISEVLDLSKIEAGALRMEVSKFELKPLLTDVEHAVQHLLAGKKLALNIDCSPKCALETDRDRLFEVLLNVVSNAVKYTEQGSVKVKARIENNTLKIVCKDTGIGIDKKDFAKLFLPFERIESHLRIKTTGTGLGLYLSQQILTQLLSGSIDVQSKLGQGSTFTIIMPINTPAIVVQKPVLVKQQSMSHDNKIDISA